MKSLEKGALNDMEYFQDTQRWLEQAEALKPELHRKVVRPKRLVRAVRDESAFQGWRMEDAGKLHDVLDRPLDRNAVLVLDMGEYVVGHFSLKVDWIGKNMDAPLRLNLIFAERPCEVAEPLDSSNCTLSRGWFQDESVTLDILPQHVELPRRYAFRYVRLEVAGCSPAYQPKLMDICCHALSSAKAPKDMPDSDTFNAPLDAIDRISIKTLEACMQTVFEDGPKRDRRLWMGDVRLQALANYATFRNYDLVKRCLYLFAGTANRDGWVSAAIFEAPEVSASAEYCLDYAVLFGVTLADYVEASGDNDTGKDLLPVTLRQIELAFGMLSEELNFASISPWWTFIDWREGLHKDTAAVGILAYACGRVAGLAEKFGEGGIAEELRAQKQKLTEAILEKLRDPESGLFVSGPDRQLSWASQVWMILAEAVDQTEGKRLIELLENREGALTPAGPYLWHYVAEALVHCGMRKKARALIEDYWGGMVDRGADTFWEVYDPENPKLSPYNNHLMNSYCHAWSCTPTWFIRSGMLGNL
ncbi:MAG: sugar hydrolase [Candidatus Sumerlaeia bacterium]